MNIAERALYYNDAFPKRPPIVYGNGMVAGSWMIGACYKNPNPLYGAYPHSYLERVHSMFPDAKKILHAFSGGLMLGVACRAAFPGIMMSANTTKIGRGNEDVYLRDGQEMELVDMHGPEQGRHPTWQGDIISFCEKWNDNIGRFDLILADPPYSADDAKKYDCPPPRRAEVMKALWKVARPGANLVWLDVQWPMHQKAQWKTWGTIGLLRSTNHRVRMVSMFEAV